MHAQPPTAESSNRTPHATHWQATTWIVAGLVLLVMILWNYAAFLAVDHDFTFQYAEYPPSAGAPINACLEHGWPWTFARRDEMSLADWNLGASLLEFDPVAFLADAVVALAIAAAAGWMYERWLRRQTRWYQASLFTLLVATLLVGGGLRAFLQHRRAHEVQQRAPPMVALILSSARYFGPVSLAGFRLPTSSSIAKPLFITVAGYGVSANAPHPGPVIASLVAIDPAACRVETTLTKYSQREGVLDWMYEIPVQDIHCRVEPDASLEPLKSMPHLRRVWINWPPGADESLLTILGELPGLELLAITGEGTQELGDQDFAFLKSLKQLRVLAIGPSQVTGRTLTYVADMPRLRTLCLPGCPLTDVDLQRLAELTTLRRLELDSPQVSEEAVRQLQRSSPRLQVVRLKE